MKQVRRLVKFISFVLFCLITDINSAQVNIVGNIYTFGPVNGNNVWHNGANILTSQMLHNHMNGMPVANTLRELARMLLAQIPIIPGGANHNVPANNNAGYITPANINDVYRSCGELKMHLLEHGHLGYFPIFSVLNENPQVKVNKLIPRGIFRIRSNILQRVMNSQRDILHWLNHYLNGGNDWKFFSRLPNYLNNLGFCIDPIIPLPGGLAPSLVNALNAIIPRPLIPAIGLNLENFTNRMINGLLTDNTIIAGNLIVNPVQQNGNFTIDVTYNNILGNGIGIGRNGAPTSTVRIVIKVLNGVISIVTMYPI